MLCPTLLVASARQIKSARQNKQKLTILATFLQKHFERVQIYIKE